MVSPLVDSTPRKEPASIGVATQAMEAMVDEADRQLAFGTAAWALARHLALILEATDSLPKGAVDRAISDALADVKALAVLTENEPQTVMASGMLEGFQTSFRDWVKNDYQSSLEPPRDA